MRKVGQDEALPRRSTKMDSGQGVGSEDPVVVSSIEPEWFGSDTERTMGTEDK